MDPNIAAFEEASGLKLESTLKDTQTPVPSFLL